jgi:hypothetical protein
MLAVTGSTIRASFANASKKEASDMSLPENFDSIDFERLDYFGWRDRKIARRAYIAVPTDDGLVCVMLKQAEASPRSRAQCSWCQDVTLPNDVALFTARKAGAAGRNGNVIGTLICANFECSSNVRKLPPVAYLGFDVEAARVDRILTLQIRATDFVAGV